MYIYTHTYIYIHTHIYIFNTSKYFEMSLTALFSLSTKNIDNIFCCLHLVESICILSQKFPQHAGYNFPPIQYT